MPLPKTDFEISTLVEGVYEAHSFAAAQKGLRFTFSIGHRLPRALRGDTQSIKQALSVITHMAIEDSQNGTVEIHVDLQSQHDGGCIVKFSVSETRYWFAVSLEAAKSKKTA